MTKLVRLNKFIASAGVSSRRGADELIKEGKVEVNGQIVFLPSTKILPGRDQVFLLGKELTLPKTKVVFALNKPVGIISTASDEKGREGVTDLINSQDRLYPIGRLDKESEGLILLTNDGDLAYQLSHPKFEVVKKYLVYTNPQKSSPEKILAILREPKKLDGNLKAFDEIVYCGRTEGLLKFEVSIHEGIKHHIRRLFGASNLEVKKLQRISYGPIALGNLKPGDYLELDISQIKRDLNI